jgi:hypothetical protein
MTKHLDLLPISFIYNKIIPTLNDPWISGIIDSEGCFHISIKNKSVNIVFDFTQKYDNNLTV